MVPAVDSVRIVDERTGRLLGVPEASLTALVWARTHRRIDSWMTEISRSCYTKPGSEMAESPPASPASSAGSRPRGPRARTLVLALLGVVVAGLVLLLVLERDRLELHFHPERQIVGKWRLYSCSNQGALDFHYPLRRGFEIYVDGKGRLRVTNFATAEEAGEAILDHDPQANRYHIREAPEQPGMVREFHLVSPDVLSADTFDEIFIQYRRHAPESESP